MDDMLFQPLAAVELAATQAQVALNHDNGVTTASEGMEKNDRWKYNGEWYNRLPFIEKNATALKDGAFNQVYEISKETATKLGMFDKAYNATVVRVSKQGVSVDLDDGVSEVGLSLFAANHGFGLPIHHAALLPGRMILHMDRAEGNLYDLSLMFHPPRLGGKNYPLWWAENIAQGIYDACVKMSKSSIFHLDLKLQNVLYNDGGKTLERCKEIFVIDFDPAFVFRVDVHPKAALLVDLVLAAAHIRVYFGHQNAAAVILGKLATPLLELYHQAKNREFDGAEDILLIDMPKSTDLVFDTPDKTLPDKVRLKRVLPAMVHYYFLDKYSVHDATKRAAKWPNWVFSDMHHSPLVPQLLHFALAHNRPSPPW